MFARRYFNGNVNRMIGIMLCHHRKDEPKTRNIMKNTAICITFKKDAELLIAGGFLTFAQHENNRGKNLMQDKSFSEI